jgi:hypothetical protein
MAGAGQQVKRLCCLALANRPPAYLAPRTAH